LEYYDLNYNIAVVSISNFHSCGILPLIKASGEQVKPYKDMVVAMGRIFQTNKLMFTSLTRRKSNLGCQQELKISTCKITKVHFVGPL
jgi:hypothetical protein